MDYIDYLWIKFAVFCVLAFIYGIWQGLNGR